MCVDVVSPGKLSGGIGNAVPLQRALWDSFPGETAFPAVYLAARVWPQNDLLRVLRIRFVKTGVAVLPVLSRVSPGKLGSMGFELVGSDAFREDQLGRLDLAGLVLLDVFRSRSYRCMS